MRLPVPAYFRTLRCFNQLTNGALRTKVESSGVRRLRLPLGGWNNLVNGGYHNGSWNSYNIKRPLSTTPVISADAEMVDVTFITNDGTRHTTKGKVGDNLLDVVVNNSVDLDGFGACEGTLACSTCHLVFKKADFDKIKDKITDEELDMLDLAYGLTDTSRLGCQVTLTKELAGVEVEVPAGVNDARS